MRILLLSLFSFSLLSFSYSHAAVPIEGCYVSVFGGYSYLPPNINKNTYGLFPTYQPNDIPLGTVNPVIVNFNRNAASYNYGYNGGGRLGYQAAPFHSELEISYVAANLRQFRLNDTRQYGVEGESTGTFLFANFYYDFPEYIYTLSPFIGAGFGYGFVTSHLNSLRSIALPGPMYYTEFKARGSAFAYNGTAGISYNYSERYSLNLAYRYIGTSGNNHFGKQFQAHLASAGIIFRLDWENYV